MMCVCVCVFSYTPFLLCSKGLCQPSTILCRWFRLCGNFRPGNCKRKNENFVMWSEKSDPWSPFMVDLARQTSSMLSLQQMNECLIGMVIRGCFHGGAIASHAVRQQLQAVRADHPYDSQIACKPGRKLPERSWILVVFGHEPSSWVARWHHRGLNLEQCLAVSSLILSKMCNACHRNVSCSVTSNA